MEAKEFVKLVQKMRDAQNAYYKNGRKQSDLIEAKRLEKQVDAALKDGIMFGDETSAQAQEVVENQPSLFE